MSRRWLPAVAFLVATVGACSTGGDKPTEANGRKTAGEARQSAAGVYWRLYRAVGDAAFTTSADGWFERCENGKRDLLRYTVRTTLDARKDKEGPAGRETAKQLTDAVAARFARVGWNLSSGLHRTATKNGTTAELAPSEFSGDGASVTFQVRGACVNADPVTDSLVDGYFSKRDVYKSSQAATAPVPTTFPSTGP